MVYLIIELERVARQAINNKQSGKLAYVRRNKEVSS